MTRELILMQGIPGSGKDWVARRDYPNHVVCSADSYFRLANPEYDMGGAGFDANKLGDAHKFCFAHFMNAAREGSRIVISNTNLEDIGLAPYIAVGRHYEYDITICRVKCQSSTASARNLHGVPSHVYDRMSNQFDKWKLNWIFRSNGVKVRSVIND